MPDTQPFPRRATPPLAARRAAAGGGGGGGLATECMTSARLLLRLFAQLAIDDNDWAAEGAGGARNGSGVEGFSDVAELDRRNEVDTTDWRDDDAVTASSSTTAGVRVLDARAV